MVGITGSPFNTAYEAIVAVKALLVTDDEVNFQSGTYPISSVFTWSSLPEGITFSGTGSPILSLDDVAASSTLFYIYGAEGSNLTVTSNLDKGDRTLTTNSVHGASVGDLMFIKSSETWRNVYGEMKKAEIRRIASVSGNTLTFEMPFRDSYTQANITVSKLTTVKDLTFDGIVFNNDNCAVDTSGVTRKNFIGVYIKYGDNITITNCTFDGIENKAIRMDNTVDSTINSNTFNNATMDGGGYGVDIVYSCQKIVIEDNIFHYCRHAVVAADTGGGYPPSPGVTRDILVRNNVSSDSRFWDGGGWDVQNQFDCHAAGENIDFVGNEASGDGYGINYQAYSGSIVANNFHDLSLYGIRVGLNASWEDASGAVQHQEEVLVLGNIIDTTGSYGIWCGDSARPATNIVISGNTVSGFTTTGILVGSTSYSLINDNVVTGNGSNKWLTIDDACSNVQGSGNTVTACATPSFTNTGTDCLDSDGGYATLYSLTCSSGVPDEVAEDTGNDLPTTITITQTSDYIQLAQTATNYHVTNIFGFSPERRCRYIVDLEIATAGAYFTIGETYLHFYPSAGKWYLDGIYKNSAGSTPTPYLVNLDNINSRITLTIDTFMDAPWTDGTEGICLVTVDDGATVYGPTVIPLYEYLQRADWHTYTFTRPFFTIYQAENSVIQIRQVDQQICTPRYVTPIGSNKHQVFGYDGPGSSHPYTKVKTGMDSIDAAGMGATIWSDSTSTLTTDIGAGVTFLQYLQGLIAGSNGWELGIHFSTASYPFQDPPTSAQYAEMLASYTTISGWFGYAPQSWCWIGTASNRAGNDYAYKSLGGLVDRRYRQIVGAVDFCDVEKEPILSAANAGYIGYPLYCHETDADTDGTSTTYIDKDDFATWLADVIANGVILIGLYGWYLRHSNIEDAKFYDNTAGDTTTISVITNAKPARVLVKRTAVTVEQDGTPITFTETDDGFIIFEAETGTITINNTVSTPTPQASCGALMNNGRARAWGLGGRKTIG